jgi:hypothetical protein
VSIVSILTDACSALQARHPPRSWPAASGEPAGQPQQQGRDAGRGRDHGVRALQP